MVFAVMQHDVDPAEHLRDQLGDISAIELTNNQFMVAVYIRPEMTKGGIALPKSVRDEDRFQGKVGLIVKMGPEAFRDPDGKWFSGLRVDVGDWVVFRPSDGWGITIRGAGCKADRGVLCRVLDDVDLKAKIPSPEYVY